MFFGIDLIQAVQAVGYPGIFAIILAESGIFFGVSLPGGSLLFTSGLLASQGILNIWILLAIVITAASLGDTIGYWFGAWVGPALFRRKDSRFFKQSYLTQTREFFDKHGARTIFPARFIPIVRTFAPILAGVANMKYSTFLFYNIAGAFLWGGGFTIAGFWLGEAVPEIENYIALIVLGIMIVTFIPFLFHLRRGKRDKAASYANNKKMGERFPVEGLGTALDGKLEMEKVRGIIFDLDDTLAESFQPPSEQILEKIFLLAERMPIAVMSGAAFVRIERDILKRAPHTADASNLYVLSDNAARCDVWKGDHWETAYSFLLEDTEREAITRAIGEAVKETRIFEGTQDPYRIIDRGTSVALAALEDGASKTKKSLWDPDMTKRPKLAASLREKLPGYAVLIGGKTTIDIVRKGISKAFGVEWLAKELDIPAAEMLFVGDAFYEGGNDSVVIPTGIQTRTTSGPEETERLIDEMLAR